LIYGTDLQMLAFPSCLCIPSIFHRPLSWSWSSSFLSKIEELPLFELLRAQSIFGDQFSFFFQVLI